MKKPSRWSIMPVRHVNLCSTTNRFDRRFHHDFRPELRLLLAASKQKSGLKSHPKLHPAGVALPRNLDPIWSSYIEKLTHKNTQKFNLKKTTLMNASFNFTFQSFLEHFQIITSMFCFVLFCFYMNFLKILLCRCVLRPEFWKMCNCICT